MDYIGSWNGSVPSCVSGKHFSTLMHSFITKSTTAPPSLTKLTTKPITAPPSVTKFITKSSSSNTKASPSPVAPVSGKLLVLHYWALVWYII